jgi:molybdate transport system ATP-binding protein
VSGGLEARVGLRLGSLDLDVEVRAPEGSVTAVLGPNGAGKTTLLRALAGLVALDDGRIAVGGRVLDEPPQVFVPTDQRRLGIVHQDYLLFPHLSVLENVAFGPRSLGLPTRAARDRARTWLERVGLADRAGARPQDLSGGQQQRVALARALVTDPAALLLDEPLAALDARTRPDVRRDLRGHLATYPGVTVLVTHDLNDAVALADGLVVLEDGRVTHAGAVADVLARPRTRYVADLIGVTLLRGTCRAGVADVDGIPLPATGCDDGPVTVTVRPDRVRLAAPGGAGTTPDRWRARVRRVEVLAATTEILVDRPDGLVAAVPTADLAGVPLRPGDPVDVVVDPGGVCVHRDDGPTDEPADEVPHAP